MEEKKNPRSINWRTWIVTATTIIQLFMAVEYYRMWGKLHDLADLQMMALRYRVESLENLNKVLENQIQLQEEKNQIMKECNQQIKKLLE